MDNIPMTPWNELDQSLKEVAMFELTHFSNKYRALIDETNHCPVALPILTERYMAVIHTINFAILKLNGSDLNSWDAEDQLRKEFVLGALLQASNIGNAYQDYTKAGLLEASMRFRETAWAYPAAAEFLGYVAPKKAKKG